MSGHCYVPRLIPGAGNFLIILYDISGILYVLILYQDCKAGFYIIVYFDKTLCVFTNGQIQFGSGTKFYHSEPFTASQILALFCGADDSAGDCAADLAEEEFVVRLVKAVQEQIVGFIYPAGDGVHRAPKSAFFVGNFFDSGRTGASVYMHVEDIQENSDSQGPAFDEGIFVDHFDIGYFPIGWCEKDVFVWRHCSGWVSKERRIASMTMVSQRPKRPGPSTKKQSITAGNMAGRVITWGKPYFVSGILIGCIIIGVSETGKRQDK